MSKREVASHASPARKLALDVGAQVRRRRAFTHDVLAAALEKARLSPEDRAFATKLCLGVSSTWGTLDEVIDRCLKSPHDIKDDVRDALRISTYEIIFLGKDEHAAVDQGVELVKYVTIRATGLANAVLRKIVGAKRKFPFGDPATDLAALARTYAFPTWLAALLVEELGHADAVEFMKASNGQAPLFIAVNRIKASDDDVIDAFKQASCELSRVDMPGPAACYRAETPQALSDVGIQSLLKDGAFVVSDAASQMVAASMLPAHYPRSYLEIGAGRGTKTILLQNNAFEAFGRQMPLTAVDNHEYKLKLLKNRISSLGIELDEAVAADARVLGAGFEGRSFDGVFIDAPCSGLGTLRRHPEIRWRLEPNTIQELAGQGLRILQRASKLVAPGGMLGYATCTVTREENQFVVKRFLEGEEGRHFKLEPIGGRSCLATQLKPYSSDAHFAVRMVRVS